MTVTDAETGEPIEGADVSGFCHSPESNTDEGFAFETDADGVTEVILPPREEHAECTATVRADGYEESDDIGPGLENLEDQMVELTPVDGSQDEDDEQEPADGEGDGEVEDEDDQSDTSDDTSSSDGDASEPDDSGVDEVEADAPGKSAGKGKDPDCPE